MRFKFVKTEESESMTLVFSTGMPVTVGPNHDQWNNLRENAGTLTEEEVTRLLTPSAGLAKTLRKISDRVSVSPYGVMLDGDPIDGDIAAALQVIETENDEDTVSPVRLTALALFLEKAKSNPTIESADNLYKWIANEGLTITPDGDFIAYKICALDSDGEPISKASGSAYVDGVRVTGKIPNRVGTVIEMPRSTIDSDGNTHCSVGLHAGTWGYTEWYGGAVRVLVKINPRDVVSVPNDHSFQKLRVCRYTVVRKDLVSKLDETLYIDDEFAPEQPTTAPEDDEAVIADLVNRIRESIKR